MIKKIIDKSLQVSRRLYYSSYYRNFSKVGPNVYIGKDVKIEHPECIKMGADVYINDFSWLSVVRYNLQKGLPLKEESPSLTIGDGTYLGMSTVISCLNSIHIGEKVLFADRCFIGDAIHGFENLDLPIIDQYMSSPGPVIIGDGSWIGIGASIMANVTIGKHSVIGANSVVTKDIPDFCVATGSPAKVVRQLEPIQNV